MGGQRDRRPYRGRRHGLPCCLTLLLLPSVAGASCVLLPPCHTLQPGGIAFIGDIVSAGGLETRGLQFTRLHRVRIVEPLYGVARGRAEITVRSNSQWQAEASWAPGRYFFNGVPDGEGLTLSDCGGPRTVKDAADTIRYVRRSVADQRSASLELRVYSVAGSAAGAVVRLEKGRRQIERSTVLADEKVRYARLDAGRHKLSVSLPQHFLERDSTDFDVPPGACLTVDARMAPDNAIGGTVMDQSGRPVSGIPVSLRHAGPEDSYWPAGVLTKADGSFEIRGIPPGAYHLGAAAGPVETMLPYAPVEYGSNPIVVTMETRLTGLTITAGRPLTPRKLRLRLAKEAAVMGKISSYDAATPGLLQSQGAHGRGSRLEYTIPQELTTRFWIYLKERVLIPPGGEDVEITLP